MTFGLYAAEELTAADGKTIPADGLIEVISLDESGHGKAISDLPMGSYYVQESRPTPHILSAMQNTLLFLNTQDRIPKLSALQPTRAKLSQMTLFTAL